MKLSGIFFGLMLLVLAYLVTVPTFEIPVTIPIIPGLIGIPVNVPFPNPLFVFSEFAILIGVAGFFCIVYGFASK